jgi:outer membrane protein assembly factor BamB
MALLDAETAWRANMTVAPALVRKDGKLQLQVRTWPVEMVDFDPLTPGDWLRADLPAQNPADVLNSAVPVQSLRQFLLPPAPGWQNVEFDDSLWASGDADLFTLFGGHGHGVGWRHPQFPYALSLRTWFGVTDPGKVKDLRLEIEYLGGAVVWINGAEVARGGMPAGPLTELTPGLDYSLEAYVGEDGVTPLPSPAALPRTQPEPPAVTAAKARLASRIRTLKVTVPANVLKSGRNLIAISLRRSAVNGPLDKTPWSHVGLHRVSLVSASGSDVASAAESRAGTRLLPSDPLEQFRGGPADPKRPANPERGLFRGAAMNGIRYPNPFATPGPVRIVAPRNGVGSGQAVLCDPAGLYGVQTKVGRIAGPGGATLPEECLRVTYVSKHSLMHTLDALMPEPPPGAATVPLFLTAQIPRDAVPGWYAGSVRVSANEQAWDLPVQILVSPAVLPDAKDFGSLMGLYSSPETVAIFGKVTPYSDEHLKLMEPSFAMQGQVGNDILHVPVVLGGFGASARDWVGRNFDGPHPRRRVPMIRWVRKDGNLTPDFTVLERFLDRYLQFCAPPKALALYLWDASVVTETGMAYESTKKMSETRAAGSTFQIAVWDPASGALVDTPAPQFVDPDAEAFWKPMLDGVRDLVKRRGWSEDCIMIGQASDTRPGAKTVELLRQWAPYARWSVLSHFSGDPGGPQADGRFIGTGGLEIGLMETIYYKPLSLASLEDQIFRPARYLNLCPQRNSHDDASSPLLFRTLALISGAHTRLSLDYWPGGPGHGSGWFNNTRHTSVFGPRGAIPTVRFQMFREGVQELEICRLITRELQGKPAELREKYGRLVDAVGAQHPQFVGIPPSFEKATDLAGRSARLMAALSELAGNPAKDRWDDPPPVTGMADRQRDEQVVLDLPASGVEVNAGTQPPLFWSMEKNLGWKLSVPTQGSAPVVFEDRVYVLHEPGTLVCLDPRTGSNVWSAALATAPAATADWPAPLVRRDGIGVILPGVRVALCDVADGRKNWLVATEDTQARHLLRWRDVLVVAGQNVTALDAGTGAVRWRRAGAGAGPDPTLAIAQGKPVLMTGNGLLLDLADGTVLLKDAFGPGVQGACLFQSSSATLFAVLTNGKTGSVAAFELPRDGKPRLAPVWKQELDAVAGTSRPLLARSRLYLVDRGELVGLNAADGAAAFRVALGESGNGPVRLSVAGERLYVETAGNGAPAAIVDVGPEPKVAWRYQATGAAQSSAFVADAQIVRAGATLWCLRGPTPAPPDPNAKITTRDKIPDIAPLPALAAADAGRLPVNPFKSDERPPVWHLAGPFLPESGYDDAMPFPMPSDAKIADLPTQIPELGRSCSLLGSNTVLRALTPADLWKDKPESLNLTAITGRRTSATLAYAVIDNDQDRFVVFDPRNGGVNLKAWLSGKPVADKDVVYLKKGRHLLSLALVMRRPIQGWAVLSLSPRLVDADAPTKAALDAYAANIAFWEKYTRTRDATFVLP